MPTIPTAMASPASMPSDSSLDDNGLLHTGSQQSLPLLETSTLSDKTLIGDDQGYGARRHPQAPMQKQKRKSLFFNNPASLNRISFVLHALLIILHTVLLGMLLTGTDHRITIPPTKANYYSVLVTVVQQAFFTVYQTILVIITQQLALRSNLLRQQTLTALHDQAVAWGGLGASILSLWRQKSVPAAPKGTLCVFLYLASISALHVSSSSLIDVDTYNTNTTINVRTIFGLPNMATVKTVDDNESWDNAGAVASALGQLPAAINYGFVNNTVYDIVMDNTGVGNTTVNATTFTVKCYSARQVYNPSSDLSVVTIEWGDLNTTLDVMPLYEGALWFVKSLAGGSEGRLLTFLSFPPIPDSNGALGTTFPVAGPVYVPVNVTQGNQKLVSWTNVTVENQIQAITCSLSYTAQHAIIDSQTNALVSVSPRADDPPAVWTPTTNLSSAESDPIVDWFSAAWNSSSLTTTRVSPVTLCLDHPYHCTTSLLNLQLSNMLGLKINPNSYVINGQIGNITNFEKSNTTLRELEDQLSILAAQVVWTFGHINKTNPHSASNTFHREGEAKVLQTVLRSRLNVNLIPVSVGLSMSVMLFVFAYILTRYAAPAEDVFTPDNVGILQSLWLFSRQQGVQEALDEVDEPSEDQLRKAGLVDVRGINNDDMMDCERKS
ncbi:hypothetical protein BDN67DRAFT_966913 [Paxillus ammoniavirescens]|nr:hypothetical protein BDN67DRAFT_966913 [Paxillus ammoniavirescens]